MTPLEMLRVHPFLAGLPEEWLPRLTGHARPVVWHPLGQAAGENTGSDSSDTGPG